MGVIAAKRENGHHTGPSHLSHGEGGPSDDRQETMVLERSSCGQRSLTATSSPSRGFPRGKQEMQSGRRARNGWLGKLNGLPTGGLVEQCLGGPATTGWFSMRNISAGNSGGPHKGLVRAGRNRLGAALGEEGQSMVPESGAGEHG